MLIFGFLISVIVTYIFYRRTLPELSFKAKAGFALLRFTSVFLLLTLMLSPVLRFKNQRKKAPEMIVLKDNSLSMTDSEANYKFPTDKIEKIYDKIEKAGYKIKEIAFADGVGGERNNTNLKKTIKKIIKTEVTEDMNQMTLISDGWIHDSEIGFLSETGIRINTILPDSVIEKSGEKITRIYYPENISKGELLPVETEFSSALRNAELSFMKDGKLLKKIKVNDKKSIETSLNIDKEGIAEIKVLLKENNEKTDSSQLIVNVGLNEKKIIVFTAEPDWNLKMLNRIIDEMAELSLNVFLYKQGKFFGKGDEISRKKIFREEPNTVIFLNTEEIKFKPDETETVKKWISRGTGLICIGRASEDLRDILPGKALEIKSSFNGTVALGHDARQFNSLKELSAVNFGDFPQTEYFYVKPDKNAKKLLIIENEEKSPAFLYQLNGKSHVAWFPVINLWQFEIKGEKKFNAFLHGLLTWFSQSLDERVIVSDLKKIYFKGEKIRPQVIVMDEKMQRLDKVKSSFKIFSGSEEIFNDFLTEDNGKFTVDIPALKSGNYNWRLSVEDEKLSEKGVFEIKDVSIETEDRGFNLNNLNRIAKLTDGESFKISSAPDFEKVDFISVVESEETDLCKNKFFISFLIFIFCLEIYFRKYSGLL
ncbi:MAG: hypothetical protein CSB55_01170 [Candidatus Cloacimonadota bacterium]|nr:MAG: hypothetical protein CSB55_01170 [Candidatus Cloacimonadota bacterium]